MLKKLVESLEVSHVIAIFTALLTLIGGAIATVWAHLTGKRNRSAEAIKTRAEATRITVDANAIVINGLKLFIEMLQKDVEARELNNIRQDRRIALLERTLTKHHIPIPEDAK